LMPRDVTPWLTALRAYSMWHVRMLSKGFKIEDPYRFAPVYHCR
jgi:hypothetical protein